MRHAGVAHTERRSGRIFRRRALHAELAALARATTRKRKTRAAPQRRVYVLPGIMGSQLGFIRGGKRPNDILWLDPIDIAFGRLTELTLSDASRIVALGAMNYSYLKLTLSLRKAGFDAVLLDYDWRRDIAHARQAAGRAHRGGRPRQSRAHRPQHGRPRGARRAHARRRQAGLAAHHARHAEFRIAGRRAGIARHLFGGAQDRHARPAARRGIPRAQRVREFSRPARTAARQQERQRPRPVRRRGLAERRVRARTPRCCRAAAGLEQRMAPADARFTMVVGCNRTTATGVALRDGDFEYEYSLQGDGTVPIELARLAGARHSYVECGHSDMPLADRVIAGTIDLLKTGATQRFAAAPPRAARLADARARRGTARAIPGEDRLAAHDAGAAAAVPRHAQRSAARPHASAPAACGRGASAHRCACVVGDVANARAAATAVAVLRGVPASGAAADIDQRLGGVIGDWLQHRVVSGDAGHVTPIPRSLQRQGTQPAHRVSAGRPRALRSPESRRHRTRGREPRAFRRGAAVPLARHRRLGRAPPASRPRILSPRSCADCCARAPRAQAGVTRVDLHVLVARRREGRARAARRFREVASRRACCACARSRRRVPRSPRARGECRVRRISSSRRSRAAASRETWRTSLLTGGSSAAIFSQSQEFAAQSLDRAGPRIPERNTDASRA